MKPTKQQLLEVKQSLREMAADGIVQALSKIPYPKHSTNDKTVHDMYDQISLIRRDLMKHVEAKTGYRYDTKGSSGWKLVKK